MKNFEERMEKLEKLSESIKSPSLSIEEAVAIFEEGLKLSKALEKDLDKLESRIEVLVNEPSCEKGSKDEVELDLFSQEDK